MEYGINKVINDPLVGGAGEWLHIKRMHKMGKLKSSFFV
jgi:hypothetical protein